MSKFGRQQQDFDQAQAYHDDQPAGRSFIAFAPVKQFIIKKEKSPIVNSIAYQKDSRRVLNVILNMTIWDKVQAKTEKIKNIKGNSESIQKMMIYFIQWESQIIFSLSQYFQRHYEENVFNENLHARLAQEVQTLISKNIRDKDSEDTINQDCEQFSNSLNFNSLFLSESCLKFNEKILKKIKQEILENQVYKILYRYGENIYHLDYQVIKYYFSQFFDKLNSKVFLDILQQLIKDPYYSWVQRKDLTHEQNAHLIKNLWLDDKNPLFQLKKASNYILTTKRLIDLDKRKIEDYLLNTAKFPLSRQELEKVRKILDSGNLQDFFDKTRYIKDQLKSVYPYVAQNCHHYLYPKKEQDCLIPLQESNLLALRYKLFQMLKKEQFNISDWDLIENSVMSNQFNKAQRAFKNQDSYFSLKQWILDNLFCYLSLAFEPIKQKDRVRRELILCLINSKVNLSYSKVITIVNELLETPYTEVIQASPLLTRDDKDQLQPLLEQLELFKRYCSELKEDSQYIRHKAKGEIFKIIDSAEWKLNSDQKEDLYQRFLNRPRASSIYQTPNICNLYKQAIFKKLAQIKEINDYIENYQKIQRTEKVSLIKSQLQSIITNNTDYEQILNHILINGQIKFENDQDCTAKLDEQYSDINKMLMKRVRLQNRKKLRELQQKSYLVELVQQLPQISKIYLNQCKDKLKYTIRYLTSQTGFLKKDKKVYLQKVILDIISKGNMNAIDENQQLKDSTFQPIVFQIKISHLFKLLSRSTNAIKANQGKYAEINLKNKIRSIYDHENFVEFSEVQKNNVINALILSIDFQQLKVFTFLNAIQQQFIIDFIIKSEEYQQFQTFKNKSSNNYPKYGNSQLMSQKSEKLIEKKRNQPPPPLSRNSQKKEEQSSSMIQPNPQTSSFPSSAKKQLNAQQLQQDIQPKEPSIESKLFDKQQSEIIKKQIIRKWTDQLAKTDKNEKSLLKRERQACVNKQQFTQKLLLAYPWTTQNVSFFQASKDVIKKKIIGELEQIIAQRGSEFIEDVGILRTA